MTAPIQRTADALHVGERVRVVNEVQDEEATIVGFHGNNHVDVNYNGEPGITRLRRAFVHRIDSPAVPTDAPTTLVGEPGPESADNGHSSGHDAGRSACGAFAPTDDCRGNGCTCEP